MRKLVVCNIMSLDGYYTGPGDDVMVLPMDEAFDAYNAERLRAADTLLVGRHGYLGFKGFWPPQAGGHAARPSSRRSGGASAPSRRWWSPTPSPPAYRPWRSTTTSSAAPTPMTRSPSSSGGRAGRS